MADEKILKEALEHFSNDLSKLKGVVGLGIRQAEDQKDTEDLRLTGYVEKKLDKAELQAEEIVPQVLQMPRAGKQVSIQTQVIEQGPVRLEAPRLGRRDKRSGLSGKEPPN